MEGAPAQRPPQREMGGGEEEGARAGSRPPPAHPHLSPLSLLKAQARATTWEVARLMTGTQSMEVTSVPSMLLSCLCSSCKVGGGERQSRGGQKGVGRGHPQPPRGALWGSAPWGTHLADVPQGDGFLVLHHLPQAPEGELRAEGGLK